MFKNQNGTQQVKQYPRSRPFLASNAIKKRVVYPLSHQLLEICGRYDTRDKKMIAIIDNFSVIYIYIYIYILGGVS